MNAAARLARSQELGRAVLSREHAGAPGKGRNHQAVPGGQHLVVEVRPGPPLPRREHGGPGLCQVRP